jgi:hypothetical protein
VTLVDLGLAAAAIAALVLYIRVVWVLRRLIRRIEEALVERDAARKDASLLRRAATRNGVGDDQDVWDRNTDLCMGDDYRRALAVQFSRVIAPLINGEQS